MPLSVNVSLSRKGHHVPNATFSINVTAELDPSLLTRPKELQERIAGLYAQAAQALDRQADAPVPSEPPPVPSRPIHQNEEKTLPDRMSRQQAADYIGVKVQTLASWATTGRYSLPFTRVGKRVLYCRADLDRWMAERTGTSTGSVRAKIENSTRR